MTRPVALMGGLPELRQRVAAGHHDYAIMLAGGAAISRKTINLLPPPAEREYTVFNHIDDTLQTLTEAELWTESNIGDALDKHALLDMSGDDGLVLIEGSGLMKGDEFLAAARAATHQAWIEARKHDGPLTFRLDAAPGAITISDAAGEDEEWEPADPSLVLEPCEIGPHTVAQIDLAAVGMGFRDGVQRAAITSIELTIEDIDRLISALAAIRQDAISNRGFALRESGYWTNGEE